VIGIVEYVWEGEYGVEQRRDLRIGEAAECDERIIFMGVLVPSRAVIIGSHRVVDGKGGLLGLMYREGGAVSVRLFDA
jgi:hypothetical protein